MLINTDVLVWCLRCQPKTLKAIDALTLRLISQITRMELICGCRDKKEISLLKRFLVDGNFQVILLSQEIGDRADLYLEEKHLSHGIGLPDALIAATSSLLGQPLFTANTKHFRCFSDIQLARFTP
jgi:predicted nucleic acid-binding protein